MSESLTALSILDKSIPIQMMLWQMTVQFKLADRDASPLTAAFQQKFPCPGSPGAASGLVSLKNPSICPSGGL